MQRARQTKVLRLSPDYFCSPLWDDDYNDPNNNPEITPETLGLSDGLCATLWAWAEIFDSTLNMDSPIDSGFKVPEDEERFFQRGMELAKLIVSELGSGASVRYRYGSREAIIQ